jgi:hypothetical protein
MKVKTEDVLKALDSLQEGFEEEVVKASEQDLDQPEGADLGNPVKEKMSDEAKSMKKVKKAEEMEEEEGEEDEEEGEDMEMEKKMKAKKSFAGDLPEEVQTKIEVSEFLKSLVDHNVDGLKKLADYVAKSDAAQETRYSELNEVVEGLAKSQAKIGVVLKAICKKLNIIENSPATAPKSEIVAKSQTNAERTFSSGLETEKGEEPVFKSLSNDPIMAKSQISNALCDLVMKGEATDMDVINFESAGFISPELVNKLKGKL